MIKIKRRSDCLCIVLPIMNVWRIACLDLMEGTYQECKVPCSKYHGATHPTFSLKQPIPVVPSSYSYEQCMWECQSQGGYSYECKPICQQYKNPRPLYSYPVSPYSYFPMQSIF